MGIIGILSLIFGIIGLIFSPFYIGIIPCIIAFVLGIIGLTDFLTEKWPSVTGLLTSILGIVLFAYTLASDLDANRLIIFYTKGDIVYLSNYEDIIDALNELTEDLDQITTSMETLHDVEPVISAPANADMEVTAPVNTEPEITASVNTEPKITASISTEPEITASMDTEAEITTLANAGGETAENGMTAPTNVEGSEPQNSDTFVDQTENNSIEVHITRTGEKYHSAGCQYLARSDIIVSLENAKMRGYEPCSRCNPPQ